MTRVSLLLVVGGFVVATAVLPAALPDSVRLDSGSISGTVGASGQVRIFKGIPYAAPPLGSLRWRAPQPVAHWDGVRKADEFGARCMQGGGAAAGRRGAGGARQASAGRQDVAPPPQGIGSGQPMSEDCLFLNVWTPAKTASERLPVMVWIHGAGLTGGSGSEPRYDGEELSKKGAVVITINYRLGPFGWLVHSDLTKESSHAASGNYGLMDAIAALQWVQKNIGSFGGDTRRVTIFGESAGAFVAAGLVGSPEAKGLFHRAIAESGAWMGMRMGPMTTRARAEEAGQSGLSSMGVASLIDLRTKPADDIQRDLRGSGLIVDGWLIPEDLSLTFERGRQNDVDLFVGSNKDEGTFFQRGAVAAEQFVSQSRQRFGDLSDSFLKLYPAGSDAEANQSSLAAFRDEAAWHMRIWAQAQAKRGKAKAYLFYFTREPAPGPGQPSRGATHTAEIPYVFNHVASAPYTEVDRTLADMMGAYWVNFAATGDPNGKGLPAWPAFRDRSSGRAMVLGDKVTVETAPDAARLGMYDTMYARLRAGN